MARFIEMFPHILGQISFGKHSLYALRICHKTESLQNDIVFWTNSAFLYQCSPLGLNVCPQFSGYVTFFCLEKQNVNKKLPNWVSNLSKVKIFIILNMVLMVADKRGGGEKTAKICGCPKWMVSNGFWTNSIYLSQCSLLVGLNACPQFSGYVTFFCLEKPKEVRYAIYRHTHAKTHTCFESMFRHSNDLFSKVFSYKSLCESPEIWQGKIGLQFFDMWC